MEREKCVVYLVPRALRENADRNAGVDFLDPFQNRFHALLDIFPVKEQTVQIFHPVLQQRIAQHFFLGDIAGRSGNPDIGHQNIEIAPMIADIENRPVFGDIFFPDYGDFDAGNPQTAAKRPFDNGEGTAVFEIHIKLSDNIFGD